MTEFCRSASIWRMTFDLSCVKVTCTPSRPGLLQLLDDLLHAVDGLDQVGAGALRHLDGHRRLAVDARDRGRVLEGRLAPARRRRASRRRPVDAATGIFSMSCGCLDQRRHLDGEAAGLRLRARRRRPGCCEALRDRDELVERDAVALHQHRLGDDLDRLVARAAQFGREHARHLLDRVLGVARDAAAACAPARRRTSATTSTG